jgi:hypothetical protein
MGRPVDKNIILPLFTLLLSASISYYTNEDVWDPEKKLSIQGSVFQKTVGFMFPLNEQVLKQSWGGGGVQEGGGGGGGVATKNVGRHLVGIFFFNYHKKDKQ